MKVVKRASPPASKICPKCMANFDGDALYCPADGIPLRAAEATTSERRNRDPYIGQVLAGHLRIDERIGSGAMGKVYRAYQEGIGRHVAIKILHGELSGNPQIAARFEKEATVASRLEHPNVVSIYLAGRTPDGAMYIAMEYLHGVSLQSALSAGVGAFPLRRVLHILLQVCHAVGEAHARNIVHRDIKPENIMLIRRGEDSDFVKVLDFGVARFHSSDQSMATATGLVFGTARYISPEGAKGERVGAQGDVYSIATVAYQLLAGTTPFEGDSAVSLLIQHIQDEPPHLGSSPFARHVPPSLAELVMRNLQKDPSKRSQDARSFGRSLLDWMSQNGFSAGDAAAVSSPSREPLLEGVSHPSRSQQESSDSISRHEVQFDDDLESVDATVKSVGHGKEQPKEYKTHPWTAPQEIGLVLPSHHRPDTGANSVPIAATEPADLDSVSENSSDAPAVPTHGLPKSLVFGISLLAVILGAFAFLGYRSQNSPSRPNIELDDYLRKAELAFQRGQMRSPPAENVYDLTGEALLRSPDDQRFVELREKSADELINRALEAMKVDPRQALSLLDDALLFEPESAVAKKLRRDVEERLSGSDKTPGSVVSAASARGRLERSPQSPQERVVALVDVRPEHPRVGQNVRLAVRLQGTSTNMAGLMEEPLFELRGAGFVQASKIRPSFDPMDGSWNTTFTFFSPGAIDVTFSGLHRKSFLKVVRRVNVEPVSANDPSSDPRGASAPSAGNPGTGSTPQEDASVGTPASPSATPPSNDRGAKWL